MTESTISSQALIDFETRLAYQDDLLAAMNQRIVEQDNEIAKLQMQLQHLNEKLKTNLEPSNSSYTLDNEPPPHY